MRDEIKSTAIYSISGLLVGALSPRVAMNITAFIGFILLYVLIVTTKKIFKKDMKWFLGNGVWPYLTTWFAVWVILLNV